MRTQDLNLEQLDTVVLLDKCCAVLRHRFGGANCCWLRRNRAMSELKTEPLLSVPTSSAIEEVFELFDKYNLRMLTVVDEENRPVGTITVDDVVSRLVKKS